MQGDFGEEALVRFSDRHDLHVGKAVPLLQETPDVIVYQTDYAYALSHVASAEDAPGLRLARGNSDGVANRILEANRPMPIDDLGLGIVRVAQHELAELRHPVLRRGDRGELVVDLGPAHLVLEEHAPHVGARQDLEPSVTGEPAAWPSLS